MNVRRQARSVTKRITVILTVLMCASVLVYAQEKADALKLYRTGRSLDSAGRSEEAKNHIRRQSVSALQSSVRIPQYGLLHGLYMGAVPAPSVP